MNSYILLSYNIDLFVQILVVNLFQQKKGRYTPMWDLENIEKQYHAKRKNRKRRIRVNRFGSVDFMRRYKFLYGKQKKRNRVAASHRHMSHKLQILNPLAGFPTNLENDKNPQVQPEPAKTLKKNIRVYREFSLKGD